MRTLLFLLALAACGSGPINPLMVPAEIREAAK